MNVSKLQFQAGVDLKKIWVSMLLPHSYEFGNVRGIDLPADTGM